MAKTIFPDAIANGFPLALMEYHCNKDGGTSVASHIFEKSLETYSDEIEFHSEISWIFDICE